MDKTRIVLAGGSGFLGSALTAYLTNLGYQVVVLTRNPSACRGPAIYVQWGGKGVGEWAEHLNGAEAVVNLAGKSVNCRYNAANRREINASRTNSVRAVDAAIQRCANPPRVLLQAASLAIYGDAGDRVCDETAPPGEGFPVETCLLWESAFNSGDTPQTRRVLLRIGFALGRGGGALAVLSKLTRCFLGGAAGHGRQYISWLHVEDLNRMIRWLMERDDLHGVFNATSPNPVTNAEFMRQLRRVLHRPWSPPVPSSLVRAGSWAMGTEACLVLTGRRCVPARALAAGFTFEFPSLDGALHEVFTESGGRVSSPAFVSVRAKAVSNGRTVGIKSSPTPGKN